MLSKGAILVPGSSSAIREGPAGCRPPGHSSLFWQPLLPKGPCSPRWLLASPRPVPSLSATCLIQETQALPWKSEPEGKSTWRRFPDGSFISEWRVGMVPGALSPNITNVPSSLGPMSQDVAPPSSVPLGPGVASRVSGD